MSVQDWILDWAPQFRHNNTLSPSAPQLDQPVAVTVTSGAPVGIERTEIWTVISSICACALSSQRQVGN
jgi:hypothetical protein